MAHLCTLCSSFAAKSLKALIRHLGLVHAHQAGFHVRCQIHDCPRTYNKFLSYKKHMYSKHQDVLGSFRSAVGGESRDESSDEDHSLYEETPDTEIVSQSDPDVFSRREALLFVLKAKHIYHIPQSSLCDIMSDFTSLLECSVNSLHSKIRDILGDIDPALLNQIDKVFNEQEITDPFYGMTTEHMQSCWIKETFKSVVSACP